MAQFPTRNIRLVPPQGELFNRLALPRQLPVMKACPEDEHLPIWARDLSPGETRH